MRKSCPEQQSWHEKGAWGRGECTMRVTKPFRGSLVLALGLVVLFRNICHWLEYFPEGNRRARLEKHSQATFATLG